MLNPNEEAIGLKVKVRYFTTLRELAGVGEEELKVKDGSVLIGLIEKVALKYGEEAFNYLFVRSTKKIDPAIQFLINGVNVQKIHGQDTKLKEGDVIAVIPPIGGG